MLNTCRLSSPITVVSLKPLEEGKGKDKRDGKGGREVEERRGSDGAPNSTTKAFSKID